MNAKETPISPTYYKILFAILLVLATGLAVWAGRHLPAALDDLLQDVEGICRG